MAKLLTAALEKSYRAMSPEVRAVVYAGLKYSQHARKVSTKETVDHYLGAIKSKQWTLLNTFVPKVTFPLIPSNGADTSQVTQILSRRYSRLHFMLTCHGNQYEMIVTPRKLPSLSNILPNK